MRLRPVPLLAATLLAAAVAAGPTCGPRGLRATYRFDLARASAGEVDVRLSLEGRLPRPLVLRGLLRDRLNGLVGVSAEWAGGALPVQHEEGSSGGMPSTRYVIDPPADALVVEVRYAVRPTTHTPPNGERELRRFGAAGASGCALALAQALVVPEAPVREARLAEVALPAGWSLATPLPERLSEPRPAAWFRLALVAGPFGDERAPAPGVRLRVPRSADPQAVDAVEEVLAALARRLGPPREEVRVVLAPHDHDEPLTTEIAGTVTTAVVEARSAEPGALRRLLRQVVPLWFGRTVLELELDEGPDAWFPLGLTERLAHSLPEELGLVARDPDASLENTWMREGSLRRVDLAENEPLATARLQRRMTAHVLVRELERALEPFGGLDAAWRLYDGSGLPAVSDPAAALALDEFVRRRVETTPRVLGFEDAWSIDLTPRPDPPHRAGIDARPLSFAFTSDTLGFLETCGCKLSQDGGVARRATVVSKLRGRDPELVLLDLGNFAPLERDHPVLDPLVESELELYLETLGLMDYDAAVIGPDELYCGSAVLRAPRSPDGLPFVGAGVRLAEAEPYAPSRVLQRGGLRVGFLGYSELVEHGPLRQAQERNMAGVRFPRSIAEVEPALRALRERADVLVVGGRMRPASLRELCREDLGVDLVLVGGYAGYEPVTGPPAGFLGRTAVVLERLTTYGITYVTAFVAPGGEVVALDLDAISLGSDVPDDGDVAARLDAFYSSLGSREDLLRGVRPLLEWDEWQRDDYVGADACAACHVAEHAQWSATPHAQAMNTLVRARRDRHPKCVQCHVVGFGATTGYRPEAPDPARAGVQCEVCHGAGGPHSRAPRADNIRRSPPTRLCLECHDAEHSDRFEERMAAALEAVRHR